MAGSPYSPDEMVPTRIDRSVLALALVAGCAIDPPSLPGGASVGESSGNAGTVPADPGPGDDDDAGLDDATSGGALDPDATDGSSGAAATAPADTDDAASSDTGVPAGESSGVGVEASTGAEPPWFAGHYEGSWDGDCSGQIPISGNGTWWVDVDAAGDVVGEYHGDFDGDIVGWVDEQGNTVATATGNELGECDWDGIVEANGEAHGNLDCPLDCSGDWSGEKS